MPTIPQFDDVIARARRTAATRLPAAAREQGRELLAGLRAQAAVAAAPAESVLGPLGGLTPAVAPVQRPAAPRR